MSLGADAVRALKDIILYRERMDQMGTKLAGVLGDLAGMSHAVVEIDKRVVRLEGFIEGAAAASSSRRPRLPRS